MSQMLKSSGAMGAATLLSRILGMVRVMVYAQFMADGPVASAFVLAFQIPNLFRRLLGEGALSAAFIPVFKQKEIQEGEAAMWKAANAVICGLAVVSAAIVAVVVLGVSFVLWKVNLDDYTRLMFELLRMMFPYMLLVCIAAVFIGMLNARGHFFIPAMGATMLNLVMIASVFFVAPRLGNDLEHQIFGLAIGVLIAGIVQAAFQLPSLSAQGFRLQWIRPWNNPVVKEVVEKMIPALVGVAAFQLNVLLVQSMAYTADTRIVASYEYAVRLMELPQGVFGISLATYLLSTLSGLAAEKKFEEFRGTLLQGLEHLSLLNFLATVLLVALSEPIIRLLFEHGKFGPDSTERASAALSTLALGLTAFSMVNIFARAFFALGDTRTPMKISVVCLGLNLIFAFWLIEPLKGAGLGLANTLSSLFNVYFLQYALKRKLSKLEFDSLRSSLIILCGSALLSGVVAWGIFRGWSQWIGHVKTWQRIGEVFVPIAVSSALYFGLAYFLQIPSARQLFEMVTERLRRTDK